MRYSIEPRDSVYIKGYELLYFDKIIDKSLVKIVSGKYNQKTV